MCSLSMYCVCHLVNTMLESPAYYIVGVVNDWASNLVPGLSQKMVIGSMKLPGRLFS